MKKHLKREPQHISDTVWFYEENDGLTCVVECRKDGAYHQTIVFKIPTRKIIAYLKRKNKTL